MDTQLVTTPKDFGQPVAFETLLRDKSSLLWVCDCFESTHPQRGFKWLQLHSIIYMQGTVLWFSPHASKPSKCFSFTCFHRLWEDWARSKCSCNPCLRKPSGCVAYASLTSEMHREELEAGPSDTLTITFMLHLLMCVLGIMRFFDMRPHPFTFRHSVLEGNCGSISPNTSPAAILPGARMATQLTAVGARMWNITAFGPRLSSSELSIYKGERR